MINLILAVIASCFYSVSIGTKFFLGGIIAMLVFSSVITRIIIIFRKDRSNWSSVFMWTTFVLVTITFIGDLLESGFLNFLFRYN